MHLIRIFYITSKQSCVRPAARGPKKGGRKLDPIFSELLNFFGLKNLNSSIQEKVELHRLVCTGILGFFPFLQTKTSLIMRY
jgi:hypothetical protein